MPVGEPIIRFQQQDGVPKAVALPFQASPLALPPEASAAVARLLGLPRLSPPPPAARPKPAITAASLLGAAPAAAPTVPGATAAPAAAQPIPAFDWGSVLGLHSSVVTQGALLSLPKTFVWPTAVVPQAPAPLDPRSWLETRPAGAVPRTELEKVSQGLWLRRLPVSDVALSNAAHGLAAAQVGIDALKLGAHPASFVAPLGKGLDGLTAAVALGEIIEETVTPRKRGYERLAYYLKRLLFIGKFVADVTPVPAAVQQTFTVVGLIVKSGDEISAIKLSGGTAAAAQS